MLDLTSFSWALKTLQPNDKIKNIGYKKNVLHALLPKMESFVGENMASPVQYGNPQSRSASFSQAQSAASNSAPKGVKFILTRNHDYAIVTIDNETLEASQGDAGSFLRGQMAQFDGAVEELTRSLAIAEYGDGSGQRGQVNAEPAENVGSFSFVLKNPEAVTNFEVGQVVNLYAALTGGSVKIADTGVSDLTITSINRDTGAIGFSTSYTSSGTIAANDYIFIKGDRGGMLKGLAAWLPETAPTAGDNFFGVDRSADVTRLAGVRFDGSALPIEEALIQGIRRLEREGGSPSHCLVNFNYWSKLETALGSKVVYCTEQARDMPEIGFRGIMIQGARGPIKVIADMNCPDGVAYLLQMDTWELCSLGQAVRVIDRDGLPMLRQTSADGFEARYVYYSQLRCTAPGYNARIKLV